MTALEKLKSMNRANLIRVYSGRHGCMCGCLGKYYADRVNKDGSYDIINKASVSRILKKLEEYGEDLAWETGAPGRNELIFYVRDGARNDYSRNYVAYFQS